VSPREEERAVLGLLVVLLRSLRHWSQAELAKASGIQKSQISLYELGKVGPSEITVKRLAAAAGVTWATVRQVLPALRALVRLSTKPSGRSFAPPGARGMAATVGRAAESAFQQKVLTFLRERLPVFATIDTTAPEPLPGPEVERAALGLLIVLLRSLRHWTQEELASASGVQRSQISAYERWKQAPRKRTLERLAAAVGAPLDEALEALPCLRELVRAAQGEPGWNGIGRFAEALFSLEVTPFLAERAPFPRD